MKMHDGQSVHDYCMTMIKDLEEFEKLELTMQKELKVDLILQSLTSSYGQFIISYHMNKLDCNLSELVNKLVTAEGILKSSRGSILTVERASSKRRSQEKQKNKLTKKQKKENKPKRDAPKKVMEKRKYFHYYSDGH